MSFNYLYKLFFCLCMMAPYCIYSDPVEFFNPNDIKRGMKGYALTVFQGETPERVELEVIEYMAHYRIEGAVLVRLIGEKIEHTQVAQGMSGSPVYIDDKLVGAIAFTYRFSKDVIGGVTPIQQMLDEKYRVKSTGFLPKDATPTQLLWGIQGLDFDHVVQRLENVSQKDRYKKVEEFVKKVSSKKQGKSPLNPGDSVAIKLVDGDIKVAGIGTVTHVDGEELYIFGHTMEHLGATSLPLSRAYIYHVLASREISFKLGVPLPGVVGSTMFDGKYAVYGRFDYEAKMIPAQFCIKSPQYTKEYNLSFARSAYFLPTMLSYIFSTLVQLEIGQTVEKKIVLSWQIDFPSGKTVRNSTAWASLSGHGVMLQYDIEDFWYDYISQLWRNPIMQVVPDNIVFNVTIEDLPKNYYIVCGARIVSNKIFSPGEHIEIELKLKEYRGDIKYQKMSIMIPKNTDPGAYQIMCGSNFHVHQELSKIFAEFYTIQTPTQLMKELARPIDLCQLNVTLVTASKGSLVGDNVLGNIPSAYQMSFTSMLKGRNIEAPKLIQHNEMLDAPIFGLDSLSITVGDAYLFKE